MIDSFPRKMREKGDIFSLGETLFISSNEVQDRPPQGTCWLFWAENNGDPKDSGRNFELPSNCLKGFR